MNLKIAVEVCNAWSLDNNSGPKSAKRELFNALTTLFNTIKRMEDLDIQYSDQHLFFRFKFDDQIPFSPSVAVVEELFNRVDRSLRSFFDVLEQLLCVIPRATVAFTMLSQGWSQAEKNRLLLEVSTIMTMNNIYSALAETTAEQLLEANLGVTQLEVGLYFIFFSVNLPIFFC
jgi:hypothetical protein